ncbi:hypothetical protein F5Y10DRAFT_271803 [Nemania abortiva]|nr:hypothetical protein F5Y10DRAFT_271803 [Nemania abortiva]
MSTLRFYIAVISWPGSILRHWVPVLWNPDRKEGSWYHLNTLGGYDVTLRDEEYFEAEEVREVIFISEFSPDNRTELNATCRRTEYDSCQTWVSTLLFYLERDHLVPEGTYISWLNRRDHTRPWP